MAVIRPQNSCTLALTDEVAALYGSDKHSSLVVARPITRQRGGGPPLPFQHNLPRNLIVLDQRWANHLVPLGRGYKRPDRYGSTFHPSQWRKSD